MKAIAKVVALAAIPLISACISIDDPNGSSNSSSARNRVTANAVGQSVASLFANLGNSGQSALHTEEGEEQSASYACLDEAYSEDGFTLSNEVPEGHYGLQDSGIDVEANTSCDETGFLYWNIEDATGEDCAGDEMTISGGSGILAFGTTEDGESALVILGDYTIEGMEVTCDIVITESSLSVECETDGEALEADSCSVDEEDAETDEGDEEDDSSWSGNDDDSSSEEEGTEDHSNH